MDLQFKWSPRICSFSSSLGLPDDLIHNKWPTSLSLCSFCGGQSLLHPLFSYPRVIIPPHPDSGSLISQDLWYAGKNQVAVFSTSLQIVATKHISWGSVLPAIVLKVQRGALWTRLPRSDSIIVGGCDAVLRINPIYISIPFLPLQPTSGVRQTCFTHPPFYSHNILVRWVRLKNIDCINHKDGFI